MKVAVIGASGYLGGLIVRHVGADPNVESILGLDIVHPKSLVPKMTFQEADVRCADFARLLAGVDVVYHLAFIVEPPKKLSMRDIDQINIEGSRRVFEGAISAGVPKIIYASSVAAYGAHPDNPVPLCEDSLLRPNNDWYYSRTKGAVEDILNTVQGHSPSTIIIRYRPSIFLGPGINNTVGKGLSGKTLYCFPEDPKIDLCWDEDVAEAFRLGLGYRRSDIFNLAGKGPMTTREMGVLMGKRVVVLRPWVFFPICRLAARLGMIPQGVAGWAGSLMRYPVLVSAKRAKERLGWRPRHDAAQTLLRFMQGMARGN